MDTTDPSEPRPDPFDDRLAEVAARTRPASSSAPCPDAGLLAGLAEDRLVAAERDEIEAHLVACDACRAAVVEVVRDGAVAAAPVPSRLAPIRGSWRFAVPAAAAVLVAAVVVLASLRRSFTTDTDEALVASAADLAVARPDLFGAFRPLRPGEEIAAALSQKRGALALFAPAGKVLDARPAFRWEAVPGVASWRVSLFTADGEPLWSEESARATLSFPTGRAELAPGKRYIWEASGDGPFGPEGSRRAFDVATVEERRVFDDAGREIDARVPARFRALLRAQFLLRHDCYAAARAAADEYVRENPDDAAGRATLAAVERALGMPDDGATRR
jgi:hypothetical protein